MHLEHNLFFLKVGKMTQSPSFITIIMNNETSSSICICIHRIYTCEYHLSYILDNIQRSQSIIPWVKYGELKLLGLGLFLPRAPGQLPSDTTNTEPGVLKEAPSNRYSWQSRRIFRVSSSEFLTAATLSSERDLFLAPLSVPQLWARATSASAS